MDLHFTVIIPIPLAFIIRKCFCIISEFCSILGGGEGMGGPKILLQDRARTDPQAVYTLISATQCIDIYFSILFAGHRQKRTVRMGKGTRYYDSLVKIDRCSLGLYCQTQARLQSFQSAAFDCRYTEQNKKSRYKIIKGRQQFSCILKLTLREVLKKTFMD